MNVKSIFVVCCLVVCVAGDALALKPSPDYQQTPEQAGIVYDDVRFETVDGVELAGWFFPFQDHEGNDFRTPGPVIILVPPTEMNMGDLLWHYFRFFRGTPWHVLCFDWRGYGASEAFEIEEDLLVIPEFVRDVNAAIDYVKTRQEWDEEHIGLFAHFVGGAVSMAAVAGRDDVSCMVARGVYTSQKELAANALKVDAGLSPRINEAYPFALEPVQIAKKVKTPVFLVAGDEDPYTTVAMSEAIYHVLAGKRQLWVAKGAGHRGAELPEVVKMPEFTAKMHAFYRRYMGTAGH